VICFNLGSTIWNDRPALQLQWWILQGSYAVQQSRYHVDETDFSFAALPELLEIPGR